MHKPPFTVGQRVKLNAHGYSMLRLDSAEAHEAAKDLVVTYMENIGYADAPIWSMDVDSPLINMFLLDSTMFEAKP